MKHESPALAPSVQLNNGVYLPTLGLGVFESPRNEITVNAVLAALESGYRHIDTASIYGNEAEVGQALARTPLPRSDIFVTTKLWNDDQGYQSTLDACNRSLQRMGLAYVDLYLVHWPDRRRMHETWRAMEQLLAEGKCRAIGVCNFSIAHLEQLSEQATVGPAVNQVEFSPFNRQDKLLAYCRARAIQLVAYSPLTHGRKLGHPVLAEIAQSLHKTPAQILLRWAWQRGANPIPKSVSPQRIRENAAIFDFSLDEDAMRRLDALHENFRAGWYPYRWSDGEFTTPLSFTLGCFVFRCITRLLQLPASLRRLLSGAT